jgi:hypothetical protein
MAAGDVVSIACNQVIRSSPNDGTCSGGVVITDGAMVFDGVNGYVENSAKIFSDNLTLSAWISPSEIKNNQGILSQRGNLKGDGFLRFTGTNGKLQFFIRSADGTTFNTFITQADVVSTINQDYHIVVISNLTNASMFVNGVQVALTQATTTASTTSTNLRIGRDDTNYFNGKNYISQIFNRQLSSTEITQIYEAGKDAYSPVTSGLVAQYSGRDYYGTAAAPTTILDTASNNNSTALFVERALKTQRVNANSKYIVEALDGKAILVNSIEEAA